MRLQKDRRKAFVIYFSFILIIMLIVSPLLINVLNTLETQTLQSSRETLLYGLEQLEAELNRIYQICQILEKDQNFHKLRSIAGDALEPGTENVAAIRELKQSYTYYLRMLSLTNDVGIIFSNRVIIADGRIHMPAEPFWGTYLYADGLSTLSEWLNFIRPTQGGYAFNATRIKSYEKSAVQRMIFSFPISLAYSEAAYCYALINEEALLRQLIQSDILKHCHFSLSWDNRTLVNYANENLSKNAVHIEAVSSGFQLSACLDIERSFFTQQLSGFYQISIIFLFAYLCLGVVLALFYSRKSVMPLSQMVKAISETTNVPYLPDGYKDVYAYVNHFIEEADKRLKANKLTMANQEILIRENLIERILRGQVFHATPSEILHKNLPDFPIPCIMRIIQFVDCGRLNSQQFASLQIVARRAVEGTLPSQTVIHFSSDLLILLNAVTEYMPQTDNRLCNDLEDATQFNIRMAISLPINTADSINPSFVHLRHLLRIADASQTLIYEDVQTMKQSHQALQYSTRFFEALMRSQLEQALKMLNEEYNVFQSTQPITDVDIQQFFYSYRHILCQVISANDLQEKITLPSYNPTAPLSDLIASIQLCAANVCAAQINRHCTQMNQREKDIINAINANLENPSLNIEVIMEMFSISNRALQNLMHQMTGTTFMNYVNAQRMERARQLLVNTDMPIREVALACGYPVLNTFYKAFQRTFAVTPNTMRTDGAVCEDK